MKKLPIILFLGLMTFALGQKRNTVFIETLGNGGFASLNYERQLTGQTGLTLRVGVGVSFLEIDRDDDVDCTGNPYCDLLNFPDSDLSMPISLQYLFDIKNNNFLETGIGYTYQFGSNSKSGLSDESALSVFYATIGFRRNFGKTKGWMWKVNFSPIIGSRDSEGSEFGFAPWGGISIGKRF